MVTLLTVYLRYRLYFCELPVREEPCTGILLGESSKLCEYLSQQIQQATDNLASPLLGVTALLHISHVVTGHIKVFRPHTVNAQFTACLAHHRIYLFYTFPQQLGIGRIAHGTLVTGGIGIERIEILHVRLPSFCQSLLLILYFQTLGQFKNDIVYEFVVGQWIR